MAVNRYATYDFYKDEFFGELEERTFNRYAAKASFDMDFFTPNYNLQEEELTDGIQFCCCELLEFIQRLENNEALKSESTGGQSASFINQFTDDKTVDDMKYAICLKYLTKPKNLMYTGV